MPGVPRELIEHELHLNPSTKPVKQHLHHFAQDKKDVMKREIDRLLDTSFIKEVYHPDWLTNAVLEPKKNMIGGYVLIILISARHAKKIHSACPESNKSWTSQ
jgi:hypothetical protein